MLTSKPLLDVINRDLTGEKEIGEAQVEIFGVIGDLLDEENFDELSRLMGLVDVSITHYELMLTFLMATYIVPGSLKPWHSKFFEQAFDKVSKHYTKDELDDIFMRFKEPCQC